jgi:hypothetical protein
MNTARGQASSGKPGSLGALAHKRAADFRASALASTIQELRAAGFISRRSLADELNRRAIPTARGGKWHYTTVVRILARQGLLAGGVAAKVSNGLAKRLAADARAEALAPTIAKIQSAGFVSIQTITRELREREIPTPQGGHWHPTTVKRLLRRLQTLETSSRTHDEGDEPQ